MGSERGYSLWGVLVFLAVVIVVVVAFRMSAQRRGGVRWVGSGYSAAAAMPRCVYPSDTAVATGSVAVHNLSGAAHKLPGGAGACYTLKVSSPTDVDAIAESVEKGKAATCGTNEPTMVMTDLKYRCVPAGGQRDGFGDNDVAPSATAQSFIGAAEHLWKLLPGAPPCSTTHKFPDLTIDEIPVIIGGHVKAYMTEGAKNACGFMPFERWNPIPMTIRNMQWIEDSLSMSCGPNVRAKWYEINAWVECPAGNATKEGFYCLNNANSRENYVGGRKGRWLKSGAEGFCASCGVSEGFTGGVPRNMDRTMESFTGGVPRNMDRTMESFCNGGQCWTPDDPAFCAGKGFDMKNARRAATIEYDGAAIMNGRI